MNTTPEGNVKLTLPFDAIDRAMLPIAGAKRRTWATASTLASVRPARKTLAPSRAKVRETAPPTEPPPP
jgi:hypothetical protein